MSKKTIEHALDDLVVRLARHFKKSRLTYPHRGAEVKFSYLCPVHDDHNPSAYAIVNKQVRADGTHYYTIRFQCSSGDCRSRFAPDKWHEYEAALFTHLPPEAKAIVDEIRQMNGGFGGNGLSTNGYHGEAMSESQDILGVNIYDLTVHDLFPEADANHIVHGLEYLAHRLRLKESQIKAFMKWFVIPHLSRQALEAKDGLLAFNFHVENEAKFRLASLAEKDFRHRGQGGIYKNLWPWFSVLKAYYEKLNKEIKFLIVTEGELEAILLNLLGFPAVTVANGASIDPEQVIEVLSDYALALKIGVVFLLFDDDKAGKYAVERLFAEASKRSLGFRLLRLPVESLFGGTDFRRFVLESFPAKRGNGQREPFKDIIEYWSFIMDDLNDPYLKRSLGYFYYSLQRYAECVSFTSAIPTEASIRREPIMNDLEDYIIDYLLPKGGFMIVAGRPKQGKSLITINIAAAIANGAPFLGVNVPKARAVAYVDLENSEATKWSRANDVKLKRHPNFGYFYLGGTSRINLKDSEALDALFQALITENVEVLIVDTLSSAFEGDDNSKLFADDIKKLFDRCQSFGISLIAIHHTNKSIPSNNEKALKGNTSISALADSYVFIEKLKDNSRPDDHVVRLVFDGRMVHKLPSEVYLAVVRDGVIVEYADDEKQVLNYIDSLVADEGSRKKKEEARYFQTVASQIFMIMSGNGMKQDQVLDRLIKNLGKSKKLVDAFQYVFSELKGLGYLEEIAKLKDHYTVNENKTQDDFVSLFSSGDGEIEFKQVPQVVPPVFESEADIYERLIAKADECLAWLEAWNDRDGGDDGYNTGGNNDENGGGDDDNGGGDGGGGDFEPTDGGDDKTDTDNEKKIENGGVTIYGASDGVKRFGSFAEFVEYLRKMETLFQTEAKTGLIVETELFDGVLKAYVYHLKAEDLEAHHYQDIEASSQLFIDLETNGEKIKLVGLGCVKHDRVDVYIISDPSDDFLRWLAQRKTVFVAHNASFELRHLFRYYEPEILDEVVVFDTLVSERFFERRMVYRLGKDGKVKGVEASYALSDVFSRRFGIELDKTLQAESNWEKFITDRHVFYNAQDVLATVILYYRRIIDGDLNKETLEYLGKLMKSVVYMAYASYKGVKVDVDGLRQAKEAVEKEVEAKLKRLDEAFERSEYRDRVKALYLQKHKNINGGRWRNSDWIKAFFKVLIDVDLETASYDDTKLYRGLNKLIDLYLDFAEADSKTKQFSSLVDNIKDGRLHSDFIIAGAFTGRMRSKEPNLQNITKENRRLFLPSSDDKVFILYDFSNIEMRLAASIYNDDVLKDIFNNGGDAHKLLASKIYRKPLEAVTKEERQLAKQVNFASLYGTTPKTLLRLLISSNPSWKDKLTENDAKHFLDSFLDLYKGLKAAQDKAKLVVEKDIREKRKLTTKIRHLHSVTYEVDAGVEVDYRLLHRIKNQLLNVHIQGAGAAGLYLTLARLHERLYSLDYTTEHFHVVACIHDEIVIECKKEFASSIVRHLKEAAKEAFCKIGDPMDAKKRPLLNGVKMDGELRYSRNMRGAEMDLVEVPIDAVPDAFEEPPF